MKRHPVFWFYVLAFVISWVGWLPMVLASHGVPWFQHPAFQMMLILPATGPTLAAIVVQRVVAGKAEANAWFHSLWRWRVEAKWLIVAIILPAAISLAGQFVAQAFDLPVTGASAAKNQIGLLISAFVIALLSNPWEEVGWRGFALPRLQKEHTAFYATLIVGLLWALWHLPLFFWKDNPMSQYAFGTWALSTVAGAFVYTWLYNSTQGSVLIVALYHVLGNTYGVASGSGSGVANAIINVAVAVIIIGVFGVEHLARNGRVWAG